MTVAPRRIHILGSGNIGRLFAHSLAQLRATHPWAPRVTLLLRDPAQLDAWAAAGRTITLRSHGVDHAQSGIDVEVVGHRCCSHDTPVDRTAADGDPDGDTDADAAIDCLIVSTKAIHTLAAVRPLLPRLRPSSTLLLAQNGIGVATELTALLSSTRPRPALYASVISHGVYATGPFRSVHAGHGSVVLGAVSAGGGGDGAANVLTRAVTAAPALNASLVAAADVLRLQLEKLVVNAVINPLTALYGVANGVLFGDEAGPPSTVSDRGLHAGQMQELVDGLLRETGSVVRAYLLAGGQSDAMERFTDVVLRERVKNVAQVTAKNRSSMLQDVSAGRETEIQYINGWVVREAEKLGIDVPMNRRVLELVLATHPAH